MKSWLVYTKEGKFQMILPSKEARERFKEQRDMDQFVLIKVNDDELSDNVKYHGQASDLYGWLATSDEEIYFHESFDQYMLEGHHSLSNTVKDILPMMKLSKEEHEIIHEFLSDCYKAINWMENEEDGDPSLVFMTSDMAKHSINSLGGHIRE